MKNAYLEDYMPEVWRHPDKIQKFDGYRLRNLEELKNLQTIEYTHMLKNSKKANIRDAHRKDKIIDILDVHEDKLSSVFYPIFKVKRSNECEYTFSEADFDDLQLQDFVDLYGLFRQKYTINCSNGIRTGFEAVKRQMTRKARWFAAMDIQMAVENHVQKVNMTRMDHKLENLQNFDDYTVFLKIRILELSTQMHPTRNASCGLVKFKNILMERCSRLRMY